MQNNKINAVKIEMLIINIFYYFYCIFWIYYLLSDIDFYNFDIFAAHYSISDNCNFICR